MRLLLFLLLLPSAAFSQSTELLLQYNSSHEGMNIAFCAGKRFGNLSILIGPKFHLNALKDEDNNNLFYRRGYASSFKQHLGFETNLIKYYNLKNANFSPFIFYSFQYSKMNARNEFYTPFDYAPDGTVLYWKDKATIGPVQFFESSFGGGITINASENFQVFLRSGVSFTFTNNLDKNIIILPGPFGFDGLSILWSVGLKFGSVKK